MPVLHHTGLTVSDLDRSLLFWRDAMGMQVLFQQEKKGGYLETIVGEPGAYVRMAHLAFDGEGTRIELFEYVSPAGAGTSRGRPMWASRTSAWPATISRNDWNGWSPRVA